MSIYHYNRIKFKDNDDDGYFIRIPKAHARGESKDIPKDIESEPHYALYIDKQMGSSYSARPTNIYWKLPKSGKFVAIELYRDGGLDYKKDEHKYVIRETDELDRRIVMGFCRKYHYRLISACHDFIKDDLGMHNIGKYYTHERMPKRIKIGRGKTDLARFYPDLMPFEESYLLFRNLKFV